jgi:hypothetical protein
MADQDNGKRAGKSDAQGSNRIQRLTLLTSFLAICAPLALGVWIYKFSEQPLSMAQQELTALSAKLKAVDLLYKMRPLLTVNIRKVYPQGKNSHKYYVNYFLENQGGYISTYQLENACIVKGIDTHSAMKTVCTGKPPQKTNFPLHTPYLLAAGSKAPGLLLLDNNEALGIGDSIHIEFSAEANRTMANMALKIANEDFKLGIDQNFFSTFATHTFTITGGPNCDQNAWCPE